MNNRTFVLGSLAAILGVATTACSAGSSGGERSGSGLGNGSGAAASSGGSGTSSGGSGNGSGATTGSGATGATGIDIDPLEDGGGIGTEDPEVCDGVDNDGNDIIDDVDEGKDGVCDCLNIATIGQIGPWSNGTDVFSTWLAARSPLGATALAGETITAEVLAEFQIVVTLHTQPVEIFGDRHADAYHDFSDAEAQALTDWIEAGGGIMTTMGYNYGGNHEEANINKALAAINFGYEDNGYITGDVTDWVEHPVTDGVLTIHSINGVSVGDTGTILAHDSGGHPALQVIESGMGRGVMWGDEWITYDSEWADVENQQIERFWLNILKWLSPAKKCQVPIPPTIK